MNTPWWLLLLLPAFLSAQHRQPYVLELSELPPPSLDSLFFNVTDVVDATGVTDGRHGSVYTGVVNNKRDLVLENSLALSLKASLLRAVTDFGRPQATLSVHYLRIDEELTMNRERRRLQLVASLTLAAEEGEGTSLHYGPRQYTEVKGGLDVTEGHATALLRGLSELLRQLDDDVRTGRTTELNDLASTFTPDDELPDGAYYSVIDFRTGRVDPSLQLEIKEVEVVGSVGGRPYHRADFQRPATRDDRQQYREVWGYHHQGRDYRYLQETFYELQPDTAGNILAVVPDMLDVEQSTKRLLVSSILFGAMGAALTKPVTTQEATEVYRLDLTTGTLQPMVFGTDASTVAGRIILHHVSAVPNYSLTIEVNGSEYLLPTNTYIAVDQPGRIVLTAGHGKAKPYYRDIALAAIDRPALYQISIDGKGRIDFDRMDQAMANVAATAVANGRLRHAGK